MMDGQTTWVQELRPRIENFICISGIHQDIAPAFLAAFSLGVSSAIEALEGKDEDFKRSLMTAISAEMTILRARMTK